MYEPNVGHFEPPNLPFLPAFAETYKVRFLQVPVHLELRLRDAGSPGLFGLLSYQVVSYELDLTVSRELELKGGLGYSGSRQR